MIPFLILALLASTEAGWPEKKSTIYVSATLTHVGDQSLWGASTSPLAAKLPISVLPACVPLLVGTVRPSKERFVAEDSAKGTHRFYGIWLTRIHKTESECEAHLTKYGEPKIINSEMSIGNISAVEHTFVSERAKPPEATPPPAKSQPPAP